MPEERIDEAKENVLWHQQESYKSLISIPVEILKALIIINGGAAFALLTYAGNIATKAACEQGYHLLNPLLCYAAGISFALNGFHVIYQRQALLFRWIGSVNSYSCRDTFHDHLRRSDFFLVVVIIISTVCFFGGSYLAGLALGFKV